MSQHSANHIVSFRKQFKINPKADIGHVFVCINAIYEANRIAFDYLGELEPADNKSGFRVNSLLNLLARIFEHSQGMLVAMATGSPTSAEALARIVVEGAVNVIYLANHGTSSTLIHFFRSWLSEHEQKLIKWRSEIQDDPHAEKITKMIDERIGFVKDLCLYVNQLESQCLIEPIEKSTEWPKTLYERFNILGRKTDYYESYHRLSGSSHLTAEDTLLWLLSLDASSIQKNNMSSEAWHYSIMMTRIACTFFVDAAVACVMTYGRQHNDDLEKQKKCLFQAVHNIAKAAGVPQVS